MYVQAILKYPVFLSDCLIDWVEVLLHGHGFYNYDHANYANMDECTDIYVTTCELFFVELFLNIYDVLKSEVVSYAVK